MKIEGYEKDRAQQDPDKTIKSAIYIVLLLTIALAIFYSSINFLLSFL